MSLDLRLTLTERDRERLRVLFLAKHARGDGRPDAEDGLHAVYHHELRQTLEAILPNLSVDDRFEGLLADLQTDFVFTMLNRGGFKNSEMLGPLMAVWQGLPHLGASPILRGVGDDKHLAKLCARVRDVSTPDSEIYRYGGVLKSAPHFADSPMMVKPNASSASWGIRKCEDWDEAQQHIISLMEDGNHDVIVERFVDGIELAVPVIPGAQGGPVLLPIVIYRGENDCFRSYQEKRFSETADPLRLCEDAKLCERVRTEVHKLMPEIWPFDFGRFEFKFSPVTGEMNFIELNMSCNLWSRKTLSTSWRSLGHTHGELIETILAGSMLRQGVIDTVKKSQLA